MESQGDDFVIAVILLEEHLSPCQQKDRREEVDKHPDTYICLVCQLYLSTLLDIAHTNAHTVGVNDTRVELLYVRWRWVARGLTGQIDVLWRKCCVRCRHVCQDRRL